MRAANVVRHATFLPLQDGDSCYLVDGMFGLPHDSDIMRRMGQRWFMVQVPMPEWGHRSLLEQRQSQRVAKAISLPRELRSVCFCARRQGFVLRRRMEDASSFVQTTGLLHGERPTTRSTGRAKRVCPRDGLLAGAALTPSPSLNHTHIHTHTYTHTHTHSPN